MIKTLKLIEIVFISALISFSDLNAQEETIDVPIEDIEAYLNSPFIYTGGTTTLKSSSGTSSNYVRSWRFTLAPIGNGGLSIISLVVDVEFTVTNNQITQVLNHNSRVAGFSAGMAWLESIFSHNISVDGKSLYWTMHGYLLAGFTLWNQSYGFTKKDVYHGSVHLDNFGLFGGGGNSEVIEVIRH